jgi:hypothetical protein
MRFPRVLISSLAVLWACSPMTTPTPTAPAAPTRATATVQADGSVLVTWTRAADAARTLLARFQPGGTAQRPEGTPAVGDAIGMDGLVIFLGDEESFVDRAAPATCGAIGYRLWTQDAQGRWSDGLAFVELPRGATTPAPSQAPSGLTATQQGQVLRLSWTNPPASSGFFQTSLVRKQGSAPMALGDGSQVLTTTGTSYAESLRAWPAGVELFYAAFACNACGRCSAAPAVVSFTVPASADGGADGGLPPDAGSPDAGPTDAGQLTDAGLDAGAPTDAGAALLTPSNFTVTLSPNGQLVQLAWVNVDAGALTSVRVTRTLTETPSGGQPSTGAPVQVFDALAASASERVDALLPSTNPARSYTYMAVGCSSAGCEATGATATLTLTLKQALRGGGYTLSWRHASADVCSDRTSLCPASPPPGQTCAQAVASTTAADWWKTCLADPPTCSTNARQLNPVSAPNETAAVNGWFTTNGVTVGRVLTSEFCRCFTTAQQFAFGPTLEYSADLTFFVYEESLRCAKTMALLNQAPAQGTNTAMVTHAGFTCPNLDGLAWSEAAIYKPQAPTTRTCTTVGTCNLGEACVSGFCVRPLFIARVPALGAGAWATLP